MNTKLFLLGVLLTVVPLLELRAGLPTSIVSLGKITFPELFLTFFLIITINILLIFFIFFFLEKIHHKLVKFNFYRRLFEKNLNRLQGKVDKLSKKEGNLIFVSLFILVSIPLPLTGVYTGSFLAWVLGLEKKKSIIAIALGTFVAGIIIFSSTIGIINLIKLI